MKALLLPGINPGTIEWITELAEKLKIDVARSHLQHYTFWSDETIQPGLSHETSYLPEEKYDLAIGKSFGSLVLMQAYMEKRIQCDRTIMLGIPIKSFEKRSIPEEALSLLQKDKTLVVQQIHDRFGNVSEFGKNRPVNLLAINGDDHLYNDYDLYIQEIEKWIKTEG